MLMSPFEKHLTSFIIQTMKTRENVISKEDANEIVRAIMPNLDELISEKIKEHFRSLANHILEKFNSKE